MSEIKSRVKRLENLAKQHEQEAASGGGDFSAWIQIYCRMLGMYEAKFMYAVPGELQWDLRRMLADERTPAEAKDLLRELIETEASVGANGYRNIDFSRV